MIRLSKKDTISVIYTKIQNGYFLDYSLSSSEDHNVDFQVLSRKTFETVVRLASQHKHKPHHQAAVE